MAEQKVKNEESVRKNESDKVEHEHSSLLRKVSYILSVMTVEPMLFFQFLGLCLKEVAESQMILYKTCRGTVGSLQACMQADGVWMINDAICFRGKVQFVSKLLLTH